MGEGFYVPDPCELTFANTLLLSNAAVSLGGAFVSLEISSSFLVLFSLFSFILAWTFISLQIKEFRIMGLLINDSVYSCVFFFLTGLHFFHLVVGLFLLSLFFWSCSFPIKMNIFCLLMTSEVHLFYNLQIFYWHFLEILWLFIWKVDPGHAGCLHFRRIRGMRGRILRSLYVTMLSAHCLGKRFQ